MRKALLFLGWMCGTFSLVSSVGATDDKGGQEYQENENVCEEENDDNSCED